MIMSAMRPGDAIRAHHRQLLQELSERVAALVEGSTDKADPEQLAAFEQLGAFLTSELLPHAAGEERAVYPAVEPLIKAHGRATATMSIDHEHIERLITEIRETARAASGAPPAVREQALASLRRLALQLEAIFRLHLEKEERVYLPLFEAHLPESEQRRVLQAMHEDGHPHSDEQPVLDVRPLPPPRRHPLIFETFEHLRPGQAFVLVNDHDPKPLFYQFSAEWPGQFTWEYLEQGPEVWRVKIGKAAG